MISMLIALISGIYMTATAWHHAAWTMVALASVVLLIVLSVTLTRPRIAALEKTLAKEKGMLSQKFQELVNHRRLELSQDSRGRRLGHCLSHDRQAGLGRLADHHGHSSCDRPCVGYVHAHPQADAEAITQSIEPCHCFDLEFDVKPCEGRFKSAFCLYKEPSQG